MTCQPPAVVELGLAALAPVAGIGAIVRHEGGDR
jgi:hypothetical protein